MKSWENDKPTLVKVTNDTRKSSLFKYNTSSDKNCAMNDACDEVVLSVADLGNSYTQIPIIDWNRYLEMELVSYRAKLKKFNHHDLTIKDFKFLMEIGAGAFGRVILTLRRDNNTYYATKVINKNLIYRKNEILNILNEKRILQSIRFPFTLYLEFFFQDHRNMYFIVPLALGGDLGQHLKQRGKLTEDHAKFYSGQILLALEYLHYLSLVFRDLKPDNILLDHMGYVKLADFGFCKSINRQRTYTICGTSEYLAPEVLNRTGYGQAVDWWAFGIVLYQLCAGFTPFHGKNREQVFNNIKNGTCSCPTYFSDLLSDILYHLLQKDESLRYKSYQTKTHKWYHSIRWLPLLNRQIEPPVLPTVSIVIDKKKSLKFDQSGTEPPPEFETFSKLFENF